MLSSNCPIVANENLKSVIHESVTIQEIVKEEKNYQKIVDQTVHIYQSPLEVLQDQNDLNLIQGCQQLITISIEAIMLESFQKVNVINAIK